MSDSANWLLVENEFNPANQNHQETIFTIGNGYLATRGAFEEGFPGECRATLVHGVFDAAPIVYTELANAPDWLPFTVWLNGERFSMNTGEVLDYRRALDLRTGVLTRTLRWRSPAGATARITFDRFTSLADPHVLFIRCRVIPEYLGIVELRAALKGDTTNEGLAHWKWVEQGRQGEVVYLRNRTRRSGIEYASAMRLVGVVGNGQEQSFWDVENTPTLVFKAQAEPGTPVIVDKYVAAYSGRETGQPVEAALSRVSQIVDWPAAYAANQRAWEREWDRTDVVIRGDDEAQLAMRFNLFQLLIAAPRHDDRVSIGAKSLSGFGYRGHAFWDTEIFMLPLFTYTAPEIARNLLNYRYHTLAGARKKAEKNGYTGAQYAWESADSGAEVTPSWVPHFEDPTRLVRIWTGDIEIHISADIAYAVYQYWRMTGDDAWMIDRGVEIILDTAKFWAARAEWNPGEPGTAGRYEYNDVIGPDEYHEHVDNNAYTNRLAQWNLQTGLEMLAWLATHAPAPAAALIKRLDLTEERLAQWRTVIAKMYLPGGPAGLIEQFEGYFQRRAVDLAALEPRSISVQALFGIEGTNQTQVLKQPDVLMLLYLLENAYSQAVRQVNYDYYTPRTDHTYGSSLGPSMQAILACRVGQPEQAYEHFIRAARADLRDARGNASDGIHAASAGGCWQAVVFGFGGLHITAEGWEINPQLPAHWEGLAFKFFYRGQEQVVNIQR